MLVLKSYLIFRRFICHNLKPLTFLLSSIRHQAREAEPKDYDLNKDEYRDLCKATYERIGDVTDGVSYKSF